MKILFSTGLFCLVFSLSQAQVVKEEDVPESVKSSFKKQFPTARAEKWEKEGENYEAEFHFNKTEMDAVFSSGGKFLATETEIPVSELPAKVREYATSQASGKKIKEASKITDHKGVVTYEAEIGDEDYIFDANGEFIKKETTDQKHEDKD